jgi:putative ABC transport system permease protein
MTGFGWASRKEHTMKNKTNEAVKLQIPGIAGFILKALIPAHDFEYTIGVYEKSYLDIKRQKGKFSAHIWLFFQLCISIPAFLKMKWAGGMVMVKNYVKISLRTIYREKLYSFINISGLMTGFACCILTFFYIQYELSYDKYHKNADHIYRILEEHPAFGRQGTELSNGNYYPLADALKDNFPEVTNAARIMRISGFANQNGRFISEKDFFFTDPEFLEIFSFSLISGDSKTALKDPFSVLITQEMAEKYFGRENPKGLTLSFKEGGREYDLKITGVLKNIPKNSHFTFDFLASLDTFISAIGDNAFSWKSNDWFVTYVYLKNYNDLEELEKKFTTLYQTHVKDERIHLQPLTNIHLGGNYGAEIETNTTSRYIYLFSTVALFVMFIACFNYINMSIARYTKRSKEIGIRKVIGAGRKDLIRQIICESLLFSFISLIFSALLVMLFLPEFNSLINREIDLKDLDPGILTLGIFILTIIVAAVSGTYPALSLSSFNPIKVLKSHQTISLKRFSVFGNLLVMLQFTVSIALIICTLFVYNQLQYIQKKQLGYDKEHLIYYTIKGRLRDQYESFNNALRKNSNILNVTTSSGIPMSVSSGPPMAYTIGGHLDWEGKKSDDRINLYGYSVDKEYLKTFNLEMSEGRFFSKEYTSDRFNFVLNESAVRAMDIQSPVGKMFNMRGKEGQIVGIVKDFHYQSLHEKIEPLILHIEPWWYRFIIIKLRSENILETIEFVKQTHLKFNPYFRFEFSFLDEHIEQFYRKEKILGMVFQYFSSLGIFIACLGIFGLAVYAAESRRKEIGIRKVLGASVPGVVMLLSKGYARWILAANLISWPIAYYAMHKWLQSFAYRVGLRIGIFILSGLVAVCIALLTIGYQTIKAATANPVDSLRYE